MRIFHLRILKLKIPLQELLMKRLQAMIIEAVMKMIWYHLWVADKGGMENYLTLTWSKHSIFPYQILPMNLPISMHQLLRMHQVQRELFRDTL